MAGRMAVCARGTLPSAVLRGTGQPRVVMVREMHTRPEAGWKVGGLSVLKSPLVFTLQAPRDRWLP